MVEFIEYSGVTFGYLDWMVKVVREILLCVNYLKNLQQRYICVLLVYLENIQIDIIIDK